MVKVKGIRRRLGLSHRSRMDIVANILQEAVGGVKKTAIMYECNLSLRQIQAYLELLINIELLRTISENKKGSKINFLETTSKGRAFLQAYHNLIVILDS